MEKYGDILIKEATPEPITIHSVLNDDQLSKVKQYALTLKVDGEHMGQDEIAYIHREYGISKVDVPAFASLLLPLIVQWYSDEALAETGEDDTSDSAASIDIPEDLILENSDFLEAEFNDPTSNDMEYTDLGR